MNPYHSLFPLTGYHSIQLKHSCYDRYHQGEIFLFIDSTNLLVVYESHVLSMIFKYPIERNTDKYALTLISELQFSRLGLIEFHIAYDI